MSGESLVLNLDAQATPALAVSARMPSQSTERNMTEFVHDQTLMASWVAGRPSIKQKNAHLKGQAPLHFVPLYPMSGFSQYVQ